MTQYHPDHLVQMRSRAAALAAASQLLSTSPDPTTTVELLTLSMILELFVTDGYEAAIGKFVSLQPVPEETVETAG